MAGYRLPIQHQVDVRELLAPVSCCGKHSHEKKYDLVQIHSIIV